MARKRHTAEEIVTKLRQVDVLTAQGRPVAEAIRSIGVTEVTYYRWRNEYGGLKGDQVRRLKELEVENARLRRAVSDLTLHKVNLDIFWLKDDTLDDPDLLPPPDEVAAEIVESLETALDRFRAVAKALGQE